MQEPAAWRREAVVNAVCGNLDVTTIGNSLGVGTTFISEPDVMDRRKFLAIYLVNALIKECKQPSEEFARSTPQFFI